MQCLYQAFEFWRQESQSLSERFVASWDKLDSNVIDLQFKGDSEAFAHFTKFMENKLENTQVRIKPI